ncbi:helix-turn-helix domain-containing protein [Candidatus Entotheonella palauensis]|uniref:XRE family transcriptional regulator n=1 Tax=Candidatus Entotheonella gemina TaxID=1429439 RepID=W4M5K8_9BACT|nr:helix-turn-helix transcriptional regulator [Candidatus Entotheonella palauensis]ETX05221.1 MAG: XRE family transcriptional regulator [Candidatus Entotheonella gemina]
MQETESITESSGNVFADLDLPEPEEALAKAELARRIGGIIKRRRLSQAQAAEVLGLDQPKVSALLRGKLEGFSTDRLLRFLNALDRDVEIVIKRKPRSRKQAEIRVVTG